MQEVLMRDIRTLPEWALFNVLYSEKCISVEQSEMF